jgi:predicted dehydrogenase
VTQSQEQQRIKVALVGTGSVARDCYLPFLSRQNDIDLFYYSRSPEKASACAKAFGGQNTKSLDDLMRHEPDTVLVLTNETQRYDIGKEILQTRPKRIFFEKPLVAKHGQAKVCEDDFFKGKELIDMARATGTETAMVFNYRFFDQVLRSKAMIGTYGFGRLIHATLLVNYACWSHCIDLLHYFGGRAAEISALAGDATYMDATDVAGVFKLENGATGTILGTNGMQFADSLYEIFLNFENGSVRLSDLDSFFEVHPKNVRFGEQYRLIGNHSRWDQYRASFEKTLSAYLDSIRKQQEPPVPGVAGLEELQFEAALRRSIASRKPVAVQEEFKI